MSMKDKTESLNNSAEIKSIKSMKLVGYLYGNKSRFNSQLQFSGLRIQKAFITGGTLGMMD